MSDVRKGPRNQFIRMARDVDTRTNEFADSSEAPHAALVAKESIGDTVHTYIGSLFFAGKTVAGGAVVSAPATEATKS